MGIHQRHFTLYHGGANETNISFTHITFSFFLCIDAISMPKHAMKTSGDEKACLFYILKNLPHSFVLFKSIQGEKFTALFALEAVTKRFPEKFRLSRKIFAFSQFW